jgi:hypothetical protein
MFSSKEFIVKHVRERIDPYFESIQEQHIQAGLLRGECILKTLMVRSRLWDAQDCSIRLCQGGSIGTLKVTVPWSTFTGLYSERYETVIEDLSLAFDVSNQRNRSSLNGRPSLESSSTSSGAIGDRNILADLYEEFKLVRR